MIVNLFKVFSSEQPMFLFFILLTMVVLKQQEKVSARLENSIVCSVRTSPDFFNNVLGELGLKKLENRIVGDQIK